MYRRNRICRYVISVNKVRMYKTMRRATIDERTEEYSKTFGVKINVKRQRIRNRRGIETNDKIRASNINTVLFSHGLGRTVD